MVAKDPMDIWEALLGFVRGYKRARIGEGVVLCHLGGAQAATPSEKSMAFVPPHSQFSGMSLVSNY